LKRRKREKTNLSKKAGVRCWRITLNREVTVVPCRDTRSFRQPFKEELKKKKEKGEESSLLAPDGTP